MKLKFNRVNPENNSDGLESAVLDTDGWLIEFFDEYNQLVDRQKAIFKDEEET